MPQLSRAFVGRDLELVVLKDAWTKGGGMQVVRGSAGVGKSRLVRELTAWAAARGGSVLVGRCTSTSREVPLRPLREALMGAARAGVVPGPDLAPFVPPLASLVPAWGSGADAATESPLVLGEAVLRLLVDLAAGRPTTILVIDDLQWADPETLSVVEYLADNVDDTPVMCLATLRDGEPGAGADLASSLIGRRAATQLMLQPLSRDDTLAVARSCLVDEELPAEVADALVDRSEGVPFLVEELLAAAISSGWDSISAAVPGSMVASLEMRLDRLPDSSRRLLSAAAVLGRHFDWRVAARTADLAETDAAELLRLAVRSQLIDVEGAGFRFHHALTRDAMLESIGPAERAMEAARALEALVDVDPQLSGDHCQLAAVLATEAGQPARAADFLIRASQRAIADGSLASADAMLTHAGGLGGVEVGATVDRLLLRVCTLSGQVERANRLGEALLASTADPGDRADIHVLLGSAALTAGRWADADRHADQARRHAGDDDALLARAGSVAAQAAMGREEVERARVLATAALESARAAGVAEVQCESLEVIGRAERGRDLAAAEAAFTEAHDVAARHGLALWRVRALQELGTIDLFDTLSPTRLDEARRVAVELGALATAAVVDLQLAALYDERGDLELTLLAARRCEEASRRWGLSTLPMSLVAQAMAHARAGHFVEMEAAVAAARATGEDQDTVEINALSNVISVYHLVVGDLPGAVAAFDRSMAAFRRRPGGVSPFAGLWALVHTLIDEGDGGEAARAETASFVYDTPVSREMLAAAEAVAAGRAGRTDEAAQRFGEADRALHRHEGGFRQGLVRLLVAPTALADGWGDPVAWLRETLAVFEHKGLDMLAARCRAVLRDADVPVPRRGRGETVPVPSSLAALGITRREADVLALVARGYTNRQVAEELVISRRTVDKHVERLLQKTGVTRAGLTAVAAGANL